MKTNTQINNMSVWELQERSLKPTEIQNEVLKTVMDVKEILKQWKMIHLKLAKVAIKTSNKISSILNMTKDDIKWAEVTQKLWKELWVYNKRVKDLLKKDYWLGASPLPERAVADDYLLEKVA